MRRTRLKPWPCHIWLSGHREIMNSLCIFFSETWIQTSISQSFPQSSWNPLLYFPKMLKHSYNVVSAHESPLIVRQLLSENTFCFCNLDKWIPVTHTKESVSGNTDFLLPHLSESGSVYSAGHGWRWQDRMKTWKSTPHEVRQQLYQKSHYL